MPPHAAPAAPATPATPAIPAIPWLRLLGVVFIIFALVDLLHDAAIGYVMEPLQDPTGDMLDDPERYFRWVRLLSLAGLGTALMGGLGMAAILVRSLPYLDRGRAAAGIVASALAASLVPTVLLIVASIAPDAESFEALQPWFDVAAGARVLEAAALLALVLLVGRGHRRVRVALVAAGLGLLATLVLLVPTVVLRGEAPAADSWWGEPFVHVRLSGWLGLLARLGPGAALWLVTGPAPGVEPTAYDRFAAAGLRHARTALWLRVALAVLATGLVVAGTMALQQAASQSMFGGSPSSLSVPWSLRAAPWVGHAEAALGIVMLFALVAATLQRRSRAGAVLVAVGCTLLLAALSGSIGLNGLLHATMVQTGSTVGYGFSGDMQRYAELAAQLDPPLRGMGLAGILCTVVGLMTTAQADGRPASTHAVRFLVLMVLFTGAWLYRESLAELGLVMLLVAPIALGMAIWALLGLSRFLTEVAEVLDPAA